jgi:uncharacterized membrane protein
LNLHTSFRDFLGLPGLDPRRFFLVAGLMGGLAFVFVTPPFQVPDEPAHFYRSYSVSQGRFLMGGKNGRPLPSSLRVLVRILVDDVPFHPERRIQPGTWGRAREVRLEPDRVEHSPPPRSLQYSSVPYLPQAAGIALGRWIGASPLGLVYFARTANLLAAVGLIYFAICQLPGYRWLAVLLALTPMAMFLRSSVSPDAGITAIAYLLTATIAKIAFRIEPLHGRWDFGLLVVLSVALCLTKPVYFPLVLAAFVIPSSRIPIRRPGLALLAVLVFSICAVTVTLAISQPSVDGISARIESLVDEVLGNPFDLFGRIVVDYIRHAPRYGAEFIGRLGWLDTALPLALLGSYLAFLMAYTVFDSGSSARVEPWQRAVLALVIAASLTAISVAMFFLNDRISGIQGRYFHPLALATAWIFHSTRLSESEAAGWLRPAGVTLLTIFSMVASLSTIFHRYYG